MSKISTGTFRSSTVSIALGAVSFALMLGALGFQYIGKLPPCEMCQWQRWPHFAAIASGLAGGLSIRAGFLGPAVSKPLTWLTLLFIVTSGILGVYHAGVEWHWWAGPQACTGNAFHYTGGKLDLNTPVVMCDVAAWRLFGISMAGYNAIVSFFVAGAGGYLIATRSSDS